MSGPNTFRLQLREDRPATIEEHKKLRDEIKRLRELNAELLEAVKRMASWADDWYPGKPHPIDDLKCARTAIAKATGGK